VFAALLAGCSQSPNAPSAAGADVSPVQDSRQLVLVIANDWDATKASLQCYDRDSATAPWRAIGEPVAVCMGRTGLAWGRGLRDPRLPGPTKREGDGKSPAGAFDLPFAFGYAAKGDARDIKLPYVPLTPDVMGVDDPKSKYYNQVVSTTKVAKDWDSAEIMLRNDDLYRQAIFINHNTSPAVPGAGSCIFMHIWRSQDKPTTGCTAMSPDHIERIVRWLDPQAKPVLVQLPRDAYQRLAKPWGLPDVAWASCP
jgi:L,D-peptidoglycan transpeptidase YkuD (ErfK/YbiS/YcfS/YnhG family)